MTWEKLLEPGETVKFEGVDELLYGGRRHRIILTDRRLILHYRGGIGEPAKHESYSLGELKNVGFRKKGLFKREGVVEVEGKTKILLEGDADKAYKVFQGIKDFKQPISKTS